MEVLWDLFDIYAFRLDLTDEQKAQNYDAESRPSKPYAAWMTRSQSRRKALRNRLGGSGCARPRLDRGSDA